VLQLLCRPCVLVPLPLDNKYYLSLACGVGILSSLIAASVNSSQAYSVKILSSWQQLVLWIMGLGCLKFLALKAWQLSGTLLATMAWGFFSLGLYSLLSFLSLRSLPLLSTSTFIPHCLCCFSLPAYISFVTAALWNSSTASLNCCYLHRYCYHLCCSCHSTVASIILFSSLSVTSSLWCTNGEVQK
jgi:hypothetical protein